MTVKQRVEKLERQQGAGEPVVVCFYSDYPDEPISDYYRDLLSEARCMGRPVTKYLLGEREVIDQL
jgi:hypothetical protein